MMFPEKEKPKAKVIIPTSVYIYETELKEVDRICDKENISRSVFARQAFNNLISAYNKENQ